MSTFHGAQHFNKDDHKPRLEIKGLTQKFVRGRNKFVCSRLALFNGCYKWFIFDAFTPAVNFPAADSFTRSDSSAKVKAAPASCGQGRETEPEPSWEQAAVRGQTPAHEAGPVGKIQELQIHGTGKRHNKGKQCTWTKFGAGRLRRAAGRCGDSHEPGAQLRQQRREVTGGPLPSRSLETAQTQPNARTARPSRLLSPHLSNLPPREQLCPRFSSSPLRKVSGCQAEAGEHVER